jgi:hypothetical protein
VKGRLKGRSNPSWSIPSWSNPLHISNGDRLELKTADAPSCPDAGSRFERPPMQKATPVRGGLLALVCLTMSYFHGRMPTIIGAKAFHGPVRDGKEWFHFAIVVRHDLSASGCSRSNDPGGNNQPNLVAVHRRTMQFAADGLPADVDIVIA